MEKPLQKYQKIALDLLVGKANQEIAAFVATIAHDLDIPEAEANQWVLNPTNTAFVKAETPTPAKPEDK